MKKDVMISIKGIQKSEGDRDEVELMTFGNFYKRNNNYYITYDESEATGFQGIEDAGNDEFEIRIKGICVRKHNVTGTWKGRILDGAGFDKQFDTHDVGMGVSLSLIHISSGKRVEAKQPRMPHTYPASAVLSAVPEKQNFASNRK